MNETMSDELSRLRAENARLRTLLACHGIAADEPEPMSPQKSVLSLEEKVALFRNLFQGHEGCICSAMVQPNDRQERLSTCVRSGVES